MTQKLKYEISISQDYLMTTESCTEKQARKQAEKIAREILSNNTKQQSVFVWLWAENDDNNPILVHCFRSDRKIIVRQ
jgi:hypothetical protein